MHRVRIEMTDHGRGKVWVDDVEVEAVIAVDFRAGLHRPNEVSITILAKEIEVTAMADEVTRYCASRPGEEAEAKRA